MINKIHEVSNDQLMLLKMNARKQMRDGDTRRSGSQLLDI